MSMVNMEYLSEFEEKIPFHQQSKDKAQLSPGLCRVLNNSPKNLLDQTILRLKGKEKILRDTIKQKIQRQSLIGLRNKLKKYKESQFTVQQFFDEKENHLVNPVKKREIFIERKYNALISQQISVLLETEAIQKEKSILKKFSSYNLNKSQPLARKTARIIRENSITQWQNQLSLPKQRNKKEFLLKVPISQLTLVRKDIRSHKASFSSLLPH